MERCAAGDHTALGELFDALAPRLRAHLGRRVDPARVDRVVRAVMLELHRARASYVVGTDVLPWALAIARRLAPQQRTGSSPAAPPIRPPRVDGSTATVRLREDLARVPEPMRSAWELVCLDRLSPSQAAGVLGVGRRRVCDHVRAAEGDLSATLHELEATHDDGGTAREVDAGALDGRVVLDRYRIERRIGGGAHGDVHLATDIRRHRQVAVKILREGGDDPVARERRFVREAQCLRRIDHPGVVHALEVGHLPDGRHCYVMDHLDGESLSEALDRRRRLPWAEVRAIVGQICATLEVVHASGIVHRDLKPGNCFVERDGRVRLLDFGVAKLVEPSQHGPATSPGVLVGTPEYMAPEQLRGEAVDGRTDVYGLGITMYELLVGRRPFVGETLVSIITQHLFGQPRRPSEVLGDAGLTGVDRVILRALAKDPADRYDSVAELAAAMNAVDDRPVRAGRFASSSASVSV